MGDCMCQMRALKEWKDRCPNDTLDFATCNYLHYLMATHTDLFGSVQLLSFSEVSQLAAAQPADQLIEFSIDWDRACEIGILKAWGEKTLGFIPSTDKPYYLVRDEEHIVAQAHIARLRQRGFRKFALLQLNTPSGIERSFLPEDWDRALDCFPEDVALIYPGPIDLALESPMRHRPNLVLLPAYDIGITAALLEQVDYVFGAHGGTIMLAHAVDQKNVTQVMFLDACSPKILSVPKWDNLAYPSHRAINWDEIQSTITKRLEGANDR